MAGVGIGQVRDRIGEALVLQPGHDGVRHGGGGPHGVVAAADQQDRALARNNGGGYTANPGTAVNGDQFTVRLTSSASGATKVVTMLFIGGYAGTRVLEPAVTVFVERLIELAKLLRGRQG